MAVGGHENMPPYMRSKVVEMRPMGYLRPCQMGAQTVVFHICEAPYAIMLQCVIQLLFSALSLVCFQRSGTTGLLARLIPCSSYLAGVQISEFLGRK